LPTPGPDSEYFSSRRPPRQAEEKLADAGEVNKLTGVCPTVALRVLWDLPGGLEDVAGVATIAGRYGVRPGSNYPGTANIRQRKRWFEECLEAAQAQLSPEQRLLIEYKPFEPAFYHTDIADWGMALHMARAAGPRAKVLVDGPSLPYAEHRTNRRVAACREYARRLSLQ